MLTAVFTCYAENRKNAIATLYNKTDVGPNVSSKTD